MANLTNLAAVKSHLKIQPGTTAYDTPLNNLIAQVSAAIETYCNREFKSTAHSDRFNGEAQPQLCLSNYPIISVTDIREDGTRAFSAASVIDTSSYYVDSVTGIVNFDRYRPQIGFGNIQVNYTAGYATIPKDIELVATKVVAATFEKRGSDGKTNESLGNYSVSYEAGEWPEDVKAVLEHYVIRNRSF